MSWARIARAQGGVLSRTQLTVAGVHGSAVDRMIAAGELEPVARAVFLVRGAPTTFRVQLWTAVLSTRGVLGFATAADLWGQSQERSSRIHVIVPHARRIYPGRDVVVHRVPVDAAAVVVREGLPITSRSWTTLDYLTALPLAQARAVADRALQQGWIELADIARRLSRHPGRHGNRRLRMLAEQLGDGAAAESERVLHRLLRSAGVRGWVPNYAVWVNGELVAVVDVAIPHRRIALEVDGRAYHSDAVRFQRDRSRQNDLVMLGWTVLRFTWSDLVDRPGYVAAAVRRVVA